MSSREALSVNSDALLYRTAKFLGVACLALPALSCSAEELPDESATEELTSVAYYDAPTEEPQRWPLSEQAVVMVNYPDASMEDDISPDTAKEIIDSSGEYLGEATGGRVATPEKVKIYEVDQTPSGEMEDEYNGGLQPCYTDQDLMEARDRAFERAGVDGLARTAIIANSALTCYDKRGWAVFDKDFPLSVYNYGFDKRLYLHEEGHLEGLVHAAKIDCPNDAGNPKYYPKVDVGNRIIAETCGVAKKYNGEPDLYSDDMSVMGRMRSEKPDNVDFYSFVELNRLAPEMVPVETVEPVPQEHVIDASEGSLRGINIKLPEGHPLQTIDKSIDKLAVGFDLVPSRSGEAAYLRAIAQGTTNTYMLGYAYPYFPAFDQDKGEVVVLTDRTLGVTITAEASAQTASPHGTILRVRPIPPVSPSLTE